MATIRTQQLAPVNFGDSNQLLQAAQRLILQGAGGIADTFGQYRQNVVDRNTANAVNLLTGAQDVNDLNQRQGQVAQILQAANGDINNEAVQRAQLTMPDTLIGRQLNNNRLTEFNQQQHDQPLLNQAMALYAAGDQKGAQNILAGVQGDASRALTFGANRADQAFSQNVQNQQLGIQAAGLALRRQAAAQRAGQASNMSKQLQSMLKTLTGANADAVNASGEAATKEQNARLTAAEKENPLNSPGTDSAATAAQITKDGRSWLTAPLPNSWRSDRGGRLNQLIDRLDPDGTLTDKQRTNMLKGMNTAFENTDLTGDPDKAALDWGKDALDKLGKVQTSRLENTQTRINQERATRIAQMQVLLQGMLGGNGQLDPMALQLLNQNYDDEE
ncbi:hypothetical protein [Kosakonia phage Kc283]|uniref:Uncharacterized protein n=1 Tax=Kosakonia phage Kc283 TaxID=2863195 RepID=A0AAE7WFJ3_9CAUD|nr:virion structural protein [Kosakonia phage Kc283]QYN79872.1 hypothetical protein [Kosakonia phage Kc283]